MFDLESDSGFDLDCFVPSSPLSSGDHHDLVNAFCFSPSSSTSSSSSGVSSDRGVVFGSYLVDRNSSTPYTDATQVIIALYF